MHCAKPDGDVKREAILTHHNRNLARVKARYTGKVISHWKDGELRKVVLEHDE